MTTRNFLVNKLILHFHNKLTKSLFLMPQLIQPLIPSQLLRFPQISRFSNLDQSNKISHDFNDVNFSYVHTLYINDGHHLLDNGTKNSKSQRQMYMLISIYMSVTIFHRTDSTNAESEQSTESWRNNSQSNIWGVSSTLANIHGFHDFSMLTFLLHRLFLQITKS